MQLLLLMQGGVTMANKYAIRQTISEVYDVIVTADSPNEAMEKANEIDLIKWILISTTTQDVKIGLYKENV